MSHLEVEAIRRVLGGEGGPQEAESATEHIAGCDRCRALAGTVFEEMRAKSPKEGPLHFVLDFIDREKQWAVEYLAAVAERAEQRRMNRRSQRDRARMSKACHTAAFFNLLLEELKEESSWEQAEFLASLALLAIDARCQRGLITAAAGHDLQTRIWTAVANARRRAAEWDKTHKALGNAEHHLKEGTGQDPRLEAELLSILASTLSNEGHISQALAALEKCKAIYRAVGERALLGRMFVQEASVVAGTEPAKGLVALDDAAPLIPADDSYLRLLAELLRVECLLEVQRPAEALQVYRRCSSLLIANPRPHMQIRARYMGARLLDTVGFRQQAEGLFTEVVESDLEHELYKAAFLDLLYLYERHIKAGDLEKAARVCRKALTNPSLAAIAHDQMRDLWTQLLEVAQHQALGQEVLRDLRQYLSVHWKHPAAAAPKVALG